MDSAITHIRPRFTLHSETKKEELLERFSQMVQNPPKELVGHIVENHIILDIAPPYQHFWSPQLNFRVESEEENENASIVSGLIGPTPSVWTLFIFIYFVIGLAGFIVSSIGISSLLLGEYSHWILAIPVSIILMISAYVFGKYGEYLAKDQIVILKDFIRKGVYKNR